MIRIGPAILSLLNLFIASAFDANARGQDSPPRTWRDNSGQFSVEASFVRVDGTNVLLRKNDGTEITVPFEKLSADDRKWISQKKGTVPKQPAETIRVDLRADVPWKFPLDTVAEIERKPKPIYAPFELDRHNMTFAEIIASRSGTWVMAMCGETFFAANGFDDQPPIVFKSGIAGSLSAISDDGRRALRTNPGSPVVEVVAIAPGTLRTVHKLDSGKRTEKGSPQDTNLVFVDFAGNDHAITVSQDGVIVAWDLTNGRPLWWLSAPGCLPSTSPGGKHLVTFADECLVAIEVASGKVIGKAKIAPRGLAQLLISPSGKRLAGIGSGVFRIWDLASGKLELDGADYSDRSQAGHAWINDRYFVFADSFHSSIFDTQVGGLIWQFWRWEADQMAVLPNYGVWLISPIPQIVVEPFRIPNQALSDLADSLYGRLGNIMGPGAPVRLEITSQNLPEALVTGIQRRLQEVCAENGIQISPGAGSKLKVYINGSTQTQGDLSFANVHLSVRLFDSDDAPHWSFGYPTLRVASNEKVPADYQMIQLPKSISRGPQMNFRGFRAGYNGLQAFRRD